MKSLIVTTPIDDDSDKVFFSENDERVGFGYRPKHSAMICLIICPDCGVENYALAVTSGICSHCGFIAHL